MMTINKITLTNFKAMNYQPQVKEEKAQTLDALLNDLNMNGKKQNDEDPFEFLGSLDDF